MSLKNGKTSGPEGIQGVPMVMTPPPFLNFLSDFEFHFKYIFSFKCTFLGRYDFWNTRYMMMVKNGTQKLFGKLEHIVRKCLNGHSVPEQWKIEFTRREINIAVIAIEVFQK